MQLVRAGVLALAATLCVCAEATAPGRVLALESGLLDDTLAVEHRADADIPVAESRGDTKRLFDALLRQMLAAVWLAHDDKAQRASERARTLMNPSDLETACLLAQAPVAGDDERATKSQARLEAMIERASAAGALWCVARMQYALGQLHDRLARNAQAAAALHEALRDFEAEGEPGWAAATRASLGWVYNRQADNPRSLQLAIDHGEASVAAAQALGWRSLMSVAHHNLAGTYMASKRLDDAQRHLARALAPAQAMGDDNGVAFISRLQARVEMERGHPELALPLFARADAIFTALADKSMQLVCRVGQVQALAALSRWREVHERMDGAQALANELDDAPSRLLLARVAMQMWEAGGDLKRALAASKEAAKALEDVVRIEDRRAANEAQERFESLRREAENVRLREEQRSAAGRQRLLVLVLLLAAALIAGLLLHARQQRRMRARLRDLAERDELTQLPNRRAILGHLRDCLGTENGAGHAVAVVDIDHFKSVNDRYGHNVGDAALRAFAAACGHALRKQDRLGRLGGEEFLAIFPAAQRADVTGIFERLRDALSGTEVPGMPPGERLSFSMGVAIAHRGADVDDVVRRADAALYAAKAEGRDRVMLAH